MPVRSHCCSRPGDLRWGFDAVPDGASWTNLHQVHGATVVTVDEPGAHCGVAADAAVSTVPGAALVVRTADCAPVTFSGRRADGAPVVGVAHAGWRGLVAGVLEATVDSMAWEGATAITATVGPHIRAHCYEFGLDDLDVAADRLGPDVRATTGWGSPALDVTAGIRSVLGGLDVAVDDLGGCTACEPVRYFSHRARRDTGRHHTVAWIEP